MGAKSGKSNGAGTNGHSATRLKVVGVAEDGLSLMLATRANAKSGPYRLALDESLLAALDEARERVRAAQAASEPPPDPEPAALGPIRVESKLTVREIQALLRQGRSVPSIARKAGVDESWIERFEVPIVWERAGMATRAQRATLVKPRTGTSAAPLGEAVVANLKARGVVLPPDAYESSWDSTRHPKTGRWTVTFTFTARGRPHVAEWELDAEGIEVHPLNKLAADLGWVQPKRRRAPAPA